MLDSQLQPFAAWRLGPGRVLSLAQPAVMAILNVTPDSFSDGGTYASAQAAAEAAQSAVAAGAQLVDIGGESTRPGAARIDPREQMRRVVPVIERIRAGGGPAAGVFITVDTTRAEVAAAALDAGADGVNDVSGGEEDPDLLPLVARRGCGVVLMHRLRPPESDSYSDRYTRPPSYGPKGVVAAVRGYLQGRARAAIDQGVSPDSIVLDPGLGFGKTVEQNMALIHGTPSLAELGFPIVSALSRKSFVGRVSGLPPEAPPAQREAGTLALSVVHYARGASIFRVHSVGPVVEALRAAASVRPEGVAGDRSEG